MSQGNGAKRKKPPSTSPASLAHAGAAGAHGPGHGQSASQFYNGCEDSTSLRKMIMDNFHKTQERFDNIERKIESQLRETLERVKEVETKLIDVVGAVTSLSMDTEKIEKETIPQMRKSLEEEKNLLKLEIERLNVYVARENVVFLGVPEEGSAEAPEKTEDVIRNLLKENLKIDEEEVNKVEFQRIHRCPATTRPRPIKARLLRYADKEMITRNAKHLKGSKIVITEDLPKDVRLARKSQMPLLHAARDAGKKVFFSRTEPRKLYIEHKYIPIKDQKEYMKELQRNASQAMENGV